MHLSLNRKQIFYLSIILLFVSILLTRIEYLIDGKTTTGEVIRIDVWSGRRTTYSAPVITFHTDSILVTFRGPTNMDADVGEKLKLIYLPEDPGDVMVYTFVGFWLSPLMWHLIVMIVGIGPVIFSFIREKDTLEISLSRHPRFFRKKHSKEIANIK